MPDEPAPEKEPRAELVRIGFRLKEFPDTHLSIFVGPSNPHYSDSSSLKWRLERLENNLRAENLFHPRLKTRYLRRGERQIHDWPDGFEALSVTPDLPDAPSIHDFAMDFRGKPADTLRPFADIQMVTGVNDNVAGATKPSLTDEEALAVWDRITSTIRVRPTKTAAQQSAESSAPRFPLGELAATGRTCRQTGWWQSSESGKHGVDRRQHIKVGERMPHIVTASGPTLWQKLKGEHVSYQRATMWKLVEYGDAPAASTQGHTANDTDPSNPTSNG